MTDLSRGVRSRRGGRRPGWVLLTVLLVLAIAASSALVFTERVELLKLAVILSLWAAAVAAFVSVIYRRQSDIDRARARDLKLVYDLQLDREISARREYELEVESQLRRELATELRSQAADEVAELRAELAALRNNLEILFDADLSHRPAIEPERTTVRAYADWQRGTGTTDMGRREARFVASTPRQEADDGTENAIIDVPEEPPLPEEPEVTREAFELYGQPAPQPEPARYAATEAMWLPPQPEQPGPGRHGRPAAREGPPVGEGWSPPAGEGWSPPGANWVGTNGASPAAGYAVPDEPVPPAGGAFVPQAGGAPAGRHSNPVEQSSGTWPTQDTEEPVDEPARQHAEGHGPSVADLMARLQAPTGSTGGRRRRRDG
jgi:hypothetical protein